MAIFFFFSRLKVSQDDMRNENHKIDDVDNLKIDNEDKFPFGLAFLISFSIILSTKLLSKNSVEQMMRKR